MLHADTHARVVIRSLWHGAILYVIILCYRMQHEADANDWHAPLILPSMIITTISTLLLVLPVAQVFGTSTLPLAQVGKKLSTQCGPMQPITIKHTIRHACLACCLCFVVLACLLFVLLRCCVPFCAMFHAQRLSLCIGQRTAMTCTMQ
jgi:hypothetical protein